MDIGQGLIRVIGVGSPLGDDAAGLEAARELAKSPPAGCEIIVADRPGVGLIELMDGAGTVILIDAASFGSPPATIHDLDLSDIDAVDGGFFSSHDLGLVATLNLARTLGRAPSRGRIIAIEDAACSNPSFEGISPAMREGIENAVLRVREWVARLAGPISSG